MSQITLLEFLQVHYSCGLPGPVQFHVQFTPDRFWHRFDSIRKELVKTAEQAKLDEVQDASIGDGPEDGEEEEEEEEDDDGYASEDDVDEVRDTEDSESPAWVKFAQD
jgi:hypothetical protein